MSTIKHSDSGMVSFTVTLIMMLVISLIVIGFSQVTRRNARESLDRQLSAQAFYAAESGVNVTTAAIDDYVAANGVASLSAKRSCANDYNPADPSGNGSPIGQLSPAGQAQIDYTCVLVNPDPTDLQYDLTQQNSVVGHIQASDNLRSLTFTWHKQSGTPDTDCSGAAVFPSQDNWTCGYGVIRVELMVKPAAGNLTNADLDTNTVVLYLTPFGSNTGTLAIPNYTAQKAYIGSGSGCSTACQVKVTLPGSSSEYYMRLTSIYRDAAKTTITGTLAAGDAAASFNGQPVVDVTGRAVDELRRVQVRVNLTPTSDIIPFALSSSNDICKHFSVQKSDPDPANNTIDATQTCQ